MHQHRVPRTIVERIAPRVLALSAMLLCFAGESSAQRAETIVGRVRNDSARVLPGAVITITRGPDRLVQATTADSAGQFALRFAQGTGDYLVHVQVPGYVSARRRVQADDGTTELRADFTLRAVPPLATVRVVATRPVRASNAVTVGEPGVGASERWADGANGQVAPTLAGDVSAIAATMPGITATPDGITLLGSGTASNLTTMNGLELASGTLPRAMRTEVRVSGATFDAARGGFSGANVDVRLAPGDRNAQRRNAFLTLDPSALQATDARGRALGASSQALRGSVGADGELVRRRLLYNVGIDYARTNSWPRSLLTVGSPSNALAGIAPDTVRELRTAAAASGVPMDAASSRPQRQRDAITWLGRLDEISDSVRTLTLTTYAAVTRDAGLGLGLLSSPSTAATRREQVLGGQFMVSQFVGPSRRVLTQHKFAASATRVTATPLLTVPTASVVLSTLSEASSGLVDVALGGSLTPTVSDRRWTLEGANDTYWNARGRQHRFHALASARMDGSTESGASNASGRYRFNSLGDFAANRPISYTRTLTPAVAKGSVWNSALALSDEWAKSRALSLIVGLRAEASGMLEAPEAGAAIQQAFGVRAGGASMRMRVSPRAGFTYAYRTKPGANTATFQNPVGRFTRGQFGVLRGGIGEFRDLWRPQLAAQARALTGASGTATQLTCVGSEVPSPRWDDFVQGGAAPAACLGEDGPLVERGPSVFLLDPQFDVPRAWRAALNWMTAVGRTTVRVDALASRSLARPSNIDLNFDASPRFELSGERGRPVFVPLTAIDAGSGTVSAAASRRSASFERVVLRTSDLAANAGQLTVTLAPDLARIRSSLYLSGALSYTTQRVREQARGFDGATFGDPRHVEWSNGAGDVRHAVVAQGGLHMQRLGTLTTFLRVQSGIPFTPLVQADINGDGRVNDRAYISRSDDAADPLAPHMRQLLDVAPRGVRRCVLENAGRVADRNSCRGPWTQQLNLQWTPPLSYRILGRAMTANVYLQNPLGGLDQLLHGADRLRGWGAQARPDPVLLYARGFDAASKAFRYALNPRFGASQAARSFNRTPFRVSLDFAVDLSVPYDVQALRRALEPTRIAGRWTRQSADSIGAFYIRQKGHDLYRLVLSESDSLLLDREQVQRLQAADSIFVREVRALYRRLGQQLAAEPVDGAGRTALDSVQAAAQIQQRLFWESVDTVGAVLSSGQRTMLPMVQRMLATPLSERRFRSFNFGYAVDWVERRRVPTR